MNLSVPHLNLTFAWVWILASFASGLVLGLRFHDENWLGGYASFPRRLYRLAHISFFGLGMVNLGYYLTVRAVGCTGPSVEMASACFILGGIAMPVCCWGVAQNARARLVFGIPIVSLLSGGILILKEVLP